MPDFRGPAQEPHARKQAQKWVVGTPWALRESGIFPRCCSLPSLAPIALQFQAMHFLSQAFPSNAFHGQCMFQAMPVPSIGLPSKAFPSNAIPKALQPQALHFQAMHIPSNALPERRMRSQCSPLHGTNAFPAQVSLEQPRSPLGYHNPGWQKPCERHPSRRPTLRALSPNTRQSGVCPPTLRASTAWAYKV